MEPVQVPVPLRCQQATGVGVAGVQGLTEVHYGLTTAYVAFERAAGGAGWGGSGRASGGAVGDQAVRSNIQRAGRASVDGREGSSGVVSLLCVREEGKVPGRSPAASAQCPELGTSARPPCREPEPDLRPHSARHRAPRWPREPQPQPQPHLALPRCTITHTAPAQAPAPAPPSPHPPWPPRRPCP
jgi:hypothetical protein